MPETPDMVQMGELTPPGCPASRPSTTSKRIFPDRSQRVLDVKSVSSVGISLATIGVIGLRQSVQAFLGKSDTGPDDLPLYRIQVHQSGADASVHRPRRLPASANTATIMSATALMVIIPTRRSWSPIFIAGRKPDPGTARSAKQRLSVHKQPPDAAGAVPDAVEPLPAGVRHAVQRVIALLESPGSACRSANYFNTGHARKGKLDLTLQAAILFVIIIWLSTVPKVLTGEPKAAATVNGWRSIASTHFPAVRNTVMGAAPCAMRPVSSMTVFYRVQGRGSDSDEAIASRSAKSIFKAGRSYMPPANVTHDRQGNASCSLHVWKTGECDVKSSGGLIHRTILSRRVCGNLS